MKKLIIYIFLSYVFVNAVVYADDALYGAWIPLEYKIGEESMPLRGIMIMTPGYFVGNTTFDIENDGILEANANSGPMTVEDGVIKLMQWMQLHWRPKEGSGNFSNPNNPVGNFLRIDIPEEIHYTIEGDKLIFHFPSGNKYISQRVKE